MFRNAVRIALSLLALAWCVSGCATDTATKIDRPPGQELLRTIASGTVKHVPWQVEVVKVADGLCVQAIVGQRVMSTECEIQTDEQRLVNFEVVGNNEIFFVQGAIHSNVDRLLRRTSAKPDIEIPYREVDGIRFFGFAAAPADAAGLELAGFDNEDRLIYTDSSKVQATVADDTPPSRSWTPAPH